MFLVERPRSGNSKYCNMAFNGIMDESKMQDIQFFDECVSTSIPLPCMPYGVLLYKGIMPVFGHRDGAHGQKNTVHALQSPKDHRVASTLVSFLPGLLGRATLPYNFIEFLNIYVASSHNSRFRVPRHFISLHLIRSPQHVVKPLIFAQRRRPSHQEFHDDGHAVG